MPIIAYRSGFCSLQFRKSLKKVRRKVLIPLLSIIVGINITGEYLIQISG